MFGSRIPAAFAATRAVLGLRAPACLAAVGRTPILVASFDSCRSAAVAAAAAATAATLLATAASCSPQQPAEAVLSPGLNSLLIEVEAKLDRLQNFLDIESAATRGNGAAIYMTGGPSGAGKDTLLLGAREALSESTGGVNSSHSVEFVKREITRDSSKCTDLEVSISVSEWEQRKAAGLYALAWEAHGTKCASVADCAQSMGYITFCVAFLPYKTVAFCHHGRCFFKG